MKQSDRDVELVNLTSHEIDIFCGQNKLTVHPSGKMCRVSHLPTTTTFLSIPDLGVVPLNLVPLGFGTIVGLPPMAPNKVYLVSSIVLQSINRQGIYRPDVLSPATGLKHGVIRDGWNIQGVTELTGINYANYKRAECGPDGLRRGEESRVLQPVQPLDGLAAL